MSNINSIKVGTEDTKRILFKETYTSPKDYQFDFREFSINTEANHDIDIKYNKITIKKFKPNVWIIKSPKYKSLAELCEVSKNLYIDIKGLSNKSSSLFNFYYQHHSVVGGSGTTQGYISGVGIFPFSDAINGWQLTTYGKYAKNRGELPFSAYTWDALTYTDGTKKSIGDDLTFRGNWGSGFSLYYNTYGKKYDSNKIKVIPDYLTIPTPNSTLNLTLGLYTGSAISFEAWECENRINALKMTISKRNEEGVGSSKSAFCYSNFKTISIKVTGLSANDRLEYGTNIIETSDNSIVADGEYSITYQEGHGFILYGDIDNTNPVTIELINNNYLDEDGYVDISNSPIVISLINERGIDPTSIESWSAYLGTKKIYHKDKTLDNCWKKYGIAYPNNWKLVKSNFTNSDSRIQWINASKFKIVNIPIGEIFTRLTINKYTNNYVTINSPSFIISLLQELPDGVSIKLVREFGNAYDTYNSSTHTWSNPTANIEQYLTFGDNVIPAVTNKLIHKKDTDEEMTYIECKIVITSTKYTESEYYIELPVQFTDGEDLTIRTDRVGLEKVIVPNIVDLEEHITKMKFNLNPANAEFWEPIKEWYATNDQPDMQNRFQGAQNLDELVLNLTDTGWQYSTRNFYGCSIKKLTLNGKENSYITSLNGFFEAAGNLKTLIVNLPENRKYLCGANDCSNMWNGCGLETYPSNFICWSTFRTNASSYSKPATMAHSMFWWSAIKNVPNYGDNPDADNNTILCGSASGMFNKCHFLETVGPIVDLQLIKPANANIIFAECTKLTTIRIKNLNHGDWHFDNTAYSDTVTHGTLEALDSDSVKYLFDNLKNLTLYDASKNQVTYNNSFANWQSDYFNSGIYTPEYDFKFASMFELVAKKRTELKGDAPFMVKTSQPGIEMKIIVSGLTEGDTLIFGQGYDREQDYEITANGSYTITKNDTAEKGFRLLGDETNTSVIKITIEKGWDLASPAVSSANIYCPYQWADKVTEDMITSANAKGWTIHIAEAETTTE